MKFISIAISCLMLASCATGTFYKLPEPQKQDPISSRYLNLDFPAHNDPVDIFLPSESVPDSMILPVRLVEQWSKSTSYHDLINLMKQTAQEKGLDGVIILERNFVNRVNEGILTARQVGTGVGFIYKHHLHKVAKLPKLKYFEVMTDSGWVEMAKAEFYNRSNLLPPSYYSDEYKIIMKEKVEPFDYNLMVSRGGRGWYKKERNIPAKSLRQHIYEKRLTSVADSYSWIAERVVVNISAQKPHLTVEHRFKAPPNRVTGEDKFFTHTFIQEKGSKEVHKIIVTQGKKQEPYMVQRPQNSSSNRRAEGIWYMLDKTGNETPFVRTRIEFYQLSDFMPSLQFAPDIPMRAEARSRGK